MTDETLQGKNEQEIVFSKAVKAGKRIYYLDAKRNRSGNMYLTITESKKIINGTDENAQVTFEKHKIFLYREDFDKFRNALNEVIDFIAQAADELPPLPVHEMHPDNEVSVEASKQPTHETDTEDNTNDYNTSKNRFENINFDL